MLLPLSVNGLVVFLFRKTIHESPFELKIESINCVGKNAVSQLTETDKRPECEQLGSRFTMPPIWSPSPYTDSGLLIPSTSFTEGL